MRKLVVALVALSACTGFPTPQVPQAHQAAQATHGAGERYRAHQRCVTLAETPQALVDCMRQEGYDLIAQGPDYPSPECWAARSSETTTANIPPHCFEHATGTPH